MASGRSGPPGSRLAQALAVGVLVGVLIVAGALVSGRGIGGREATGGRRIVREGPQPPVQGDEPAPEGWRRGAPGPLRHREFAVQVWTGSELVIWGGDTDGDSGAAYDPDADRWRFIAPAPIPARCQGAAAWTGAEVLVWGQACRLSPGPSPGRSRYATAGAAYDPAADRWRVLPVGPISASSVTMSVWTGAEWLVANPVGPAAAFDPAGNRWRMLEPVPRRFSAIVGEWTGREVVVLGTEVLEKGSSTVGTAYRHWAAAFDPALNRWRPLPEPPLELAATAVWDGRRLVAWDMNLHAAAVDPDGGGWERLPDVPVDFADCSPQGARVGEAIFAAECGRGALFRPSTGTWERIPHPSTLAEKPVWTGRDALFWVGRFAGSADGVWLYRPERLTPPLSGGTDGRHRQPVPMGRKAS